MFCGSLPASILTLFASSLREVRYPLSQLMMKLIWYRKRLDAAEIELFRTKYMEQSRFPIPLEYLKRVKVYGFFYGGQMVAGYALGDQLPLRSFGFVTTAVGQQIVIPSDFAEQCVEIVCAWRRKDVPLTLKLCYHLFVSYDVWRTGKKYVMAGANMERVAQVHMLGMPRLLYRGISEPQGVTGKYWVYYGTQLEATRGSLKLVLGRLFGKEVRVKNIDQMVPEFGESDVT